MDLSAYLRQDVGRGDLTTELTVPDRQGTAGIVCQEDAVVAGLEEAEELFSLAGAVAEPLVSDGDRVKAGTRVMTVSGPLKGLITVAYHEQDDLLQSSWKRIHANHLLLQDHQRY